MRKSTHGALRITDTDFIKELCGTGLCGFFVEPAMQSEWLDQLIANPHKGIQACHRVLEDHRDIASANSAQFRFRQRQ